MKSYIGVLTIGILLFACQESETVTDFTGNEATYALQQASAFNVNGTVTFKEKKDGTALILVALQGTEGETKLPVHLHLGDISTPGAEVAALLNPVIGNIGKSETNLLQLADDTKMTYNDLIQLGACIKVHLSDVGPERDIVLAGGNIGAFATMDASNGRVGFGYRP